MEFESYSPEEQQEQESVYSISGEQKVEEMWDKMVETAKRRGFSIDKSVAIGFGAPPSKKITKIIQKTLNGALVYSFEMLFESMKKDAGHDIDITAGQVTVRTIIQWQSEDSYIIDIVANGEVTSYKDPASLHTTTEFIAWLTTAKSDGTRTILTPDDDGFEEHGQELMNVVMDAQLDIPEILSLLHLESVYPQVAKYLKDEYYTDMVFLQ